MDFSNIAFQNSIFSANAILSEVQVLFPIPAGISRAHFQSSALDTGKPFVLALLERRACKLNYPADPSAAGESFSPIGERRAGVMRRFMSILG